MPAARSPRNLAGRIASSNGCRAEAQHAMNATRQLHDLGQSLWLDNITRDLLTSGTLKRYIDELSVTGLTSNPTIFDHAIKNSAAYDARSAGSSARASPARRCSSSWRSRTSRAPPICSARSTSAPTAWTAGSRCEVSPLLAYDTKTTLSPRPRNCTRAPGGRTCSSRFPAPGKGCPRSRRRSSPACRST